VSLISWIVWALFPAGIIDKLDSISSTWQGCWAWTEMPLTVTSASSALTKGIAIFATPRDSDSTMVGSLRMTGSRSVIWTFPLWYILSGWIICSSSSCDWVLVTTATVAVIVSNKGWAVSLASVCCNWDSFSCNGSCETDVDSRNERATWAVWVGGMRWSGHELSHSLTPFSVVMIAFSVLKRDVARSVATNRAGKYLSGLSSDWTWSISSG